MLVGCKERCPFDDFVRLLKDNIPTDLEAECRISYFEEWMSSKGNKSENYGG